jgi:hypothetical protein
LKSNKGGYGLIYQNIMQNPDIPAYSKAIYAYLCSYADTEGVCYPSTNRIMSELGMSKNTLYKYMAYLLDFGIVKIEKTRTDKGLLSRNIYHITHNIDVSKYEIPCHEIPCHEIPCHEIPQNETQTVIDYNSNTINNNILNSTTDNTAEIYTSSTTSTLSNNIHTLSTVSNNIPTVEQVQSECNIHSFEVEPAEFVEHCKSHGIKDWHLELTKYAVKAAGRNRNRRKEMKE